MSPDISSGFQKSQCEIDPLKPVHMGNLKKMKSKCDIRSQKLFLTDACILYLFAKWNHSSS